MEVKKIKNIITAIGNPILNNELKKTEKINIINNDILYQEGILEILENNKKIDFLILSQLLPGKYTIEELIEKIQEINKNIKIIIILEKYNNELENILIQKGIYRIFFDNKIEIKDIIKIIYEDEKMEKYNEEIRREINELKEYIKNNEKNKKTENKYKINKEKNRKKNNNKNITKIIKIKNKLDNSLENIINKLSKNKIINNIIIEKINKKYIFKKLINKKIENTNKIISVLGNNGVGKSVFSVLIANYLEKYYKKILIIDFDILNNSLHTILGVKKYSEKINSIIKSNNIINEEINIDNLIIKINKKIDLISGINLLFNKNSKISGEKINEILGKLKNKYDKIIIDTTSECFFEHTKELINNSNTCVYLTEANLLEISKTKRILDIYQNNWNIEKNKIKIIFNKFNKNSIDFNLLKKLYVDYEVLGTIKINKKYNSLINMNFKNIFDKNAILKNYKYIGNNFI